MRRRRRKLAAAAGAVLLIPAVAAGEPAAFANSPDVNPLADVGRGLVGLTDPDDVSADGKLGEDDQIGVDVLRDAGNPDLLAQEGLELPTGPLGIPGVMLQAYQRAADNLAKSQPNCHMHWSLLASIGRIESNHARGGQVFANGYTVREILGPVLNGGGFAAIADTDGGTLDGDTRWDRAVGAMQFIPSTWRGYASDGNGDRISNPHNVFDATLAAGKYLCSGGLDMANPAHRATAVFRYNHSDSYVRTVLIWADAYAKGVTPLPSTPVPTIPPLQQASPGAVDSSGNNNNGGGSTPPGGDTGNGGSSSSSTTTTTTTEPPTCETTSPPPTSDPSSTSPTPTTPSCDTTTPPTSSDPSSTSSNPPATESSTQSSTSSSSVEPTTTRTTVAESSTTAAESSSSPAEEQPTSPVGP